MTTQKPIGMDWYNNCSAAERARWHAAAGSAVPADAYRAFCEQSAQADAPAAPAVAPQSLICAARAAVEADDAQALTQKHIEVLRASVAAAEKVAAVALRIEQPYTLAEIRAKIASHDYNAEHMLQHAMLLLEQIARSWGGCMYDAPGETIDIGADIRAAAARLVAEQLAAVAGPAEPTGWREQFAAAVYDDLAAADNQDVPLEEYPARILKVLDAVVGPRHPAVILWRNDAIQACIAIAYKYCRDPESFQYLKQDLQGLVTAVPKLAAAPQAPAAPAWADQAVIEYQYTGGTHWCELGPAERMRANFDGVYRLQPGVYPTAAAPAAPVEMPGSFVEWFTKNYPRDTIIVDPAWHAQSIFRMAQAHARLAARAAPAAPAVDALAERDAAFEAVRNWLCGLQRYSFVLDDDGVVRRTQDRTGNWIEFDAAHELFDPVAVDAALAAQAAAKGAV